MIFVRVPLYDQCPSCDYLYIYNSFLDPFHQNNDDSPLHIVPCVHSPYGSGTPTTTAPGRRRPPSPCPYHTVRICGSDANCVVVRSQHFVPHDSHVDAHPVSDVKVTEQIAHQMWCVRHAQFVVHTHKHFIRRVRDAGCE